MFTIGALGALHVFRRDFNEKFMYCGETPAGHKFDRQLFCGKGTCCWAKDLTSTYCLNYRFYKSRNTCYFV